MAPLILAAWLAALDPAPPADTPPQTPPPPPKTSALQIARDNLDQAQQIYTQSCGDRAYGAYDDLCEQLSIQVRNYRNDVDKLERAAGGLGANATPPPKSQSEIKTLSPR